MNDEDIRYLQKEATALKDGDNISIVPSIAGGATEGFMPIMKPAATTRCCCRFLLVGRIRAVSLSSSRNL